MRAVTFDHFGRPCYLDKYHISVRTLNRGDFPTEVEGTFLEVTVPDIGPEPD